MTSNRQACPVRKAIIPDGFHGLDQAAARNLFMRTPQIRLEVRLDLLWYLQVAMLFATVALAAACTVDAAAKKQRYLVSGDRYFGQGKFAEAIVEYRNAI